MANNSTPGKGRANISRYFLDLAYYKYFTDPLLHPQRPTPVLTTNTPRLYLNQN